MVLRAISWIDLFTNQGHTMVLMQLRLSVTEPSAVARDTGDINDEKGFVITVE